MLAVKDVATSPLEPVEKGVSTDLAHLVLLAQSSLLAGDVWLHQWSQMPFLSQKEAKEVV